jgi:UDPglucose--hexose-1-phosphate uridylyltransferase
MIEVYLASLIHYAVAKKLLDWRDVTIIKNHLIGLFELDVDIPLADVDNLTIIPEYPDQILEDIYHYLSKHPNYLYRFLDGDFDKISCYLMGLVTPLPSVIESNFYDLVNNKQVVLALKYFYQLSLNNFYIKLSALKNNRHWQYQSRYGTIELTINLAKPEKDPRQIAMLKSSQEATTNSYPQCILCKENEGYLGDLTKLPKPKPARFNHRLITLTLNHQKWFFQYSPYMYYNEHSIVFSECHRDMLTHQDSFLAMFDFVTQFPHYFIGSNADLPIIGGSILNHDHFQAGNYIFPIESATNKAAIVFNDYPQARGYILNWPLTVMKLIGNKADLINLATTILHSWRSYTSVKDNLYAYTAQINHNGLTSILRNNQDDSHTLYLMLRNNRTSDEFPDGIFHPHQGLHHIKKENIGLMEAAGLAILPGRLNRELEIIEDILRKSIAENEIVDTLKQVSLHQEWLTELDAKFADNGRDIADLNPFLANQVAERFIEVLECCAVFNDSARFMLSWQDFLSGINADCSI